MNINAKLHCIDFDKLLTHIQTPNKTKGPLANFFTKTVKIAISPFVVKRVINSPSILKRLIFSIADEYGVAISELTINTKVFLPHNRSAESSCGNFLNASIIIDNIDYSVLSTFILESMNSANKANHNAIQSEAIRIIKPFINETVATIPPSAISELFELLAKDKLIEMAKGYGVTLSDVALHA